MSMSVSGLIDQPGEHGDLRGGQAILGEQRFHGLRFHPIERPKFRLRGDDFLSEIFHRSLEFDVPRDEFTPWPRPRAGHK